MLTSSVVVASPWTSPLRHPEFISGSLFRDAESSSAWRGGGSVTLNSFQGLFLRCWIEFSMTR
jgi:hypothetical protein